MRHSFATITALAALLALPAAAGAVTFSGNDMNLVGSANMQGLVLQLTNSYGQAGAAWLTAGLSTSSSFTASYSFALVMTDPVPMADGISFALQNQGTNVVGIGGGDVGYTGLNGVGSIIQTWYNNTAGLNTDGNAYNTQAAPTALGNFPSVTGFETVNYNASTDQLTMNGTLNIGAQSLAISDSANVNLAAKFGPTMYAGFTGGTGASTSNQTITGFSISAVPEPSGYGMMLAGMGLAGCMARRTKNNQQEE